MPFPERTDYLELPCGDNALFYGSLTLVKGWLLQNKFEREASLASRVLEKFDFSKCMHRKSCPSDRRSKEPIERPWAVAMTLNSETNTLFPFDWNVWADEGGVVGMIATLSGGVTDAQYISMVEEQQRYSPCQTWRNITVENTAYFNSVFTLPTRSFLGFGTLFSSPQFHEFAVRSMLPTFRAHRQTRGIVGDDFFGPSDAMSQGLGSVSFFPPNTQYRPCDPDSSTSNKCTWCEGKQYFWTGHDEGHHVTIPHGDVVAFLNTATMEPSQFSAWLDDTKRLMTDHSGVYHPGMGFEIIGPNRATPPRHNFLHIEDTVLDHGRGYFEALGHGYTTLSVYEGLSSLRRRFELLQEEGARFRLASEPVALYKPLSDWLDNVPGQRDGINRILDVATSVENPSVCEPSAFGAAGHESGR